MQVQLKVVCKHISCSNETIVTFFNNVLQLLAAYCFYLFSLLSYFKFLGHPEVYIFILPGFILIFYFCETFNLKTIVTFYFVETSLALG